MCRAIWDELNKDLGVSAANFGIAGDRVLHLLWRMQVGCMYALALCIRATSVRTFVQILQAASS